MKILYKAGRSIAKRPWISIGVVLLITLVAMGSILTNGLDFAMNEEDFTPDNPIVSANAIVSDAFTSTDSVVTVVQSGNVFTKESFLAALQFDKEIMSNSTALGYLIDPSDYTHSIYDPIQLIAIQIVLGTNSTNLTLDNLINVISVMSDAQIQMSSAYMLGMSEQLASLFTKDLNISATTANASGAMVIISLNKQAIESDGNLTILEFETVADDIASSVSESSDGTSVSILAENILMDSMGNMAQEDLGSLFPIALAAIIVILLFLYRDVIDMLISTACLILAVIWTFGFGVMTGVGISTVSIAVPILILGLGIDYGLHLVFRYREKRMEGGDDSESAGYTLSTAGEALVLATLTTVVAFLSYLTSSMQMLADFGVLSALGILCSFIVMMMVIPSTQVMRDRRAEAKGRDLSSMSRYKGRGADSKDYVGSFAQLGGRAASSKPMAVLLVSGLLLVGFGYGAVNVSYEFDLFDFLPEESEGAQLLSFVYDNFEDTGISTASVLIYGNATDPELISAMEESIANMADTEDVVAGASNAVYIGSVLHDVYVSTNDTNPYHTMYPSYFNSTTGRILSTTTALNVQTLVGMLVTSGDSNVLRAIASVMGTDDAGDAITQISIPITDVISNDDLLVLKGALDSDIAPMTDAGYDATVTGASIANAVVMDEMSQSQMESLFITLAFTILVLTLVMYYLYRSLLLGVLATMPTLLSVVAVWGTMYILGISLNVMTLTIAALTVGMGVTYGIHVTHRFNAEIAAGNDPSRSILRTMKETGKGVLGAALTTSVGFAIIGFSAMIPMQQFGMITAIAILYSYLGASFVLPALLVLWGRRRNAKSTETA